MFLNELKIKIRVTLNKQMYRSKKIGGGERKKYKNAKTAAQLSESGA